MRLPLSRLLTGSVVLFALTAHTHAQIVEIKSIDKVKTDDKTLVCTADISPDGKYVVLSDYNRPGLTKLDFQSGKTTRLSEKGDGFNVQISDDSKEVLYREYTTDANKLRYATLKSVNVATKKEQTLIAKTRDLQGASIADGKVLMVNNKRLISKSISATTKKAQNQIILSVQNGQLYITQNGSTKLLSPQGTQNTSYIWEQLSPDKKHICYYLCGVGCFVCDLEGRNVKAMGILRDAKWLNNNTLVGMREYDNGSYITKSSIIAKNVDNLREQTLTPSSIVATYPSVCSGKITFTTPKGELYLITLK